VKTETEEDTRRWKDRPCSWAGRINILNTTLVSKESYKFSAIPPKIPTTFFIEIEKILKFLQKHKVAKTISEQKEQCWRYHNI
jgi:hypothetical protein